MEQERSGDIGDTEVGFRNRQRQESKKRGEGKEDRDEEIDARSSYCVSGYLSV